MTHTALFASLPADLQNLSISTASVLFATIWQGLVLFAAASIGLRLAPKLNASLRFTIWLVVFSTIGGLPLLPLFAHHGQTAYPSGHTWFTLDPRWCIAFLITWTACSLVRAVAFGIAVIRLHGLWKRATPVSSEMMETLLAGRQESRKFLLTGAQLCTSDEIDRPSVIGFFSPRILLPASLLEHLSTQELQQIVLHEAGHLRRRDDWVNLLQKAALVLFPLNPALSLIERRLCSEREFACDEGVLAVTGSPKAYARCLATLAEHRISRRALSLALGLLGRPSHLRRRVDSILQHRASSQKPRAGFALSAAGLLVLVISAGLSRCPQLLSFAGSPELVTIAAEMPVTAVSLVPKREDKSLQTVVFHPHATAHATSNGTANINNAYKLQRVEVKVQPQVRARLAGRPTRRFASNPQAEQVILFGSWGSAPEANLVFTLTDQPVDLHPYAAVPTREGWLVVQL